MVESTGLENQRTATYPGSNPAPPPFYIIRPKMRLIEYIVEEEPQPINITIVKPESTT